MKIQLVGMLSAAALAFCLVGCGDDDGGSGGGGTAGGGTGGDTGTGNSGTGGSGNSGTGAAGGSTGGGGGGTGCQTCSEFQDDPNPDSDNLCTDNGPPSSAEIYTDVITCICTNVCTTECADSACAATPSAPMAGDACDMCLDNLTAILAACGPEAQACLGDM